MFPSTSSPQLGEQDVICSLLSYAIKKSMSLLPNPSFKPLYEAYLFEN